MVSKAVLLADAWDLITLNLGHFQRSYGFVKHTLPDLRRRWRPHVHLHGGRLREDRSRRWRGRASIPPPPAPQAGALTPAPPRPRPPRAAALLSGSLAPARAPGAWPRALANGEARRVKLRDGRHRWLPPPRRGLPAPRLRIGRNAFIFKRNLLSLLADRDACQRDVALLLGREGGNRGAPAPRTEWPTGSREPTAIRVPPCGSGVAG